MTLKKAIQALAGLGFRMSTSGGCVKGTIESESFDFSPHIILTKPNRDAFIGQTSKGWHISSYINFKARHRSENFTFIATILNIIGEGTTLEEAVKMFSANFKAKIYEGETNKMAVQPSENLMGVVLPPDWLR